MKESVRKTLMFLMAVGFLTGFALLLYPMFSNMWNEYNSKLKFEEYQHENAEKAEDTSLEEEWEKAAAYNERLQPIVIPDSFIQAEQEEVTQQDSEYMSCLNQNGDGMMGYLSIPKIGEIISVYHTSREEVLQKGAGHIQGSSLPIGGTSTHASIAAHRGIPGMSLFTDLDLLEEGDQFYLYILDEILAYEVDQIETVMPEDTEILNVEEGKDYVTLVTCTPYGVNTQRLLVRGHRVPYVEEQEKEQERQAKKSIHTNYLAWIFIGIIAAIGSIVICRSIIWMIKKKSSHGTKGRKHRNKIVCKILFIMICFAGLQPESVRAEENIPVSEPCSITFEIPNAYRAALKEQKLELRLYRIADITETGEYRDLEKYSGLNIQELSVESSAREYKKKAEDVAASLGVTEWDESAKTEPDAEIELTDNTGNKDGMEAGVYLVCMKPLYLSDEIYQADPYLITLPGFMENIEKTGDGKYVWMKDAVVDLKLARKAVSRPQEPQEEREEPVTPLETEEIKTGDETEWQQTFVLLAASGSILAVLLFLGKVSLRRKRDEKRTSGRIDDNIGGRKEI